MIRCTVNTDMRQYAKEREVGLFEVAQFYQISYQTLFNRSRVPFTDTQRADFVAVVDKIAQSHTAVKDW